MLQPPLDPKLVFLTCIFLRNNIDVEQKQNSKSEKQR